MFASALLLLAAAAQVLGSPVQPRKLRAVNYVDKFDNRVALVASANPVDGTAGGALYYNAWDYDDAATTTLTPASEPNVISSGPGSFLSEGQPFWKPMNSSIYCFDQKSIFYACVTETQATSVPVSCTLQVSGVNALTGVTVVQQLLYNSNVAAPMGFATFPALTFSCLSEVSVALIQTPITGTLTSLIFDNNNYTAYYTS